MGHIAPTVEQQRIMQVMPALGLQLFARGPLVRTRLIGTTGEIVGVGFVDTGADFSCVHSDDAERVGCAKLAEQTAFTAAGPHTLPIYQLTLDIQGVRVHEARGLDLTPFRSVDSIPDLIAVIGRDVLAHCRFTYDGRGRFSLEAIRCS